MTVSDTAVLQMESSRDTEKRKTVEGRKRKEKNGRMRDKETEERGGRM